MGLLPVTKQVDRERIQSLHDEAVALGATCHCQQYDKALKSTSTVLERFNPNHYGPGERGGQFAPADDAGGSSRDDAASAKPVEVAHSGQIATDAQIAQEDDDEREDEESDSLGPARAALYNSARTKLNAIDPSNAAVKPIVTNPGWTPSKDDVNNMEAALNRAIVEQAANAAEHGYEEHIGEFPDVHSQIELQLRAQDVIRNSKPEFARDGRTFFYQSSTNTLVVINTSSPEDSTVFRPEEGRAYVDRNLKR